MEYIHSGSYNIQARTAIGLYAAAEEFGFEELKESCFGFLTRSITPDSACYFLKDTERFRSKRSVDVVLTTLLKFIQLNAEKIFSEATIVILSQTQLMGIFCMKDLIVPELVKFHAAVTWTKTRWRAVMQMNLTLQDLFAPFLSCLRLTQIPIQQLVEDVRKARVVPERLLAHACAHNEMKDNLKPSSSSKFDGLLTIPRNANKKNKQQGSPVVVGISQSTGYGSRLDLTEPETRTLGRPTKKNKKKQERGVPDIKVDLDDSSSNSNKFLAASKLSKSTPCLDLLF